MTKKKQNAKVPLTQFLAIIVLSISVFFVIDFARRAAANYRVQREAERMSQEVELVQQRQQQLQARRDYVASDLFVEELARRELKWARPGETVVVVMPTPEAAAQTSTRVAPAASIGPTARTPAEAWWLLFFGDAATGYTRVNP